MDFTEQVTKWVENKIEKVINQDLKEKIAEGNSAFNLEVYVDNLFDKCFDKTDIRNFKKIFKPESYYDLLYFESETSAEESIHESLESDFNECRSFSVQEIIKNLQSEDEEIKKKFLKLLESFVEDLINQPSWNKIKKILQKLLSTEKNMEILVLILKVLQKLLEYSKKPEIVSKGFATVVDVIGNQIELFNIEYKDPAEELYIVESKGLLGNSSEIGPPKFGTMKSPKFVNPEVLIKIMWLLIDCQQHVAVKWIRFNELRFREIIFSFIHLLSSTNYLVNKKLSGLELLSVLSPTASWCRYWCHTAVGRYLLCSALRKYKSFFIQIIEIILNHMKIKKPKGLPPITVNTNLINDSPEFICDTEFNKNENNNYQNGKNNYIKKTNSNKKSKCISSAPENIKSNSSRNSRLRKPKKLQWIIENIPKEIVSEAVFIHSISFVSYLIQFRSGRALFPVKTTTRERLLSVQDLSLSIIEYLENNNYKEWSSAGITYTAEYETKVLEVLDIMKTVKANNNSSRMSVSRQQFS